MMTMEEALESARDELMRKTDEEIAELSRNTSCLNDPLRLFIEELYSAYILEGFAVLGYSFTRSSCGVTFLKRGRIIAGSDVFFEGGDYVMSIEVMLDLIIGNVDKHLLRMANIREYMDDRGDRRVLIGAVAGGIVPKKVQDYALEKGLYVLAQSGESAAIVETPVGFKVMEWRAPE